MLRPGQAVGLCVLALLTIGVVMVNSAGLSIEPKEAVTVESIILSRSTVYMFLALAAMALTAFLPVRAFAHALTAGRDREPANIVEAVLSLKGLWILVALFIGLLMTVYLPVIGRTVNGSHRWLLIPGPGGGISVQPSEIVKWAMLVVIAWYASTRAAVMPSFWRGLVPALAATAIVSFFVVIEDLGTGFLIAAVAALVLIAGGARFWHFLAMAPIGLAAIAAAVIVSPYRVARLTAFLDPYADPERTGYHMIQSMIAVANGRVFGRGLGHGLQKFGYLPEDRTDFLFAVICEELGLVGAVMVVALYAGLLFSGLWIVRREPSPFLKLLALGILSTVGVQAVINLAVVTGLGPTKGIALPMLSSGGTGWILTAASLGVLIAIDRSHRALEHTPDEAEGEPAESPVVITTTARNWLSFPTRQSGA